MGRAGLEPATLGLRVPSPQLKRVTANAKCLQLGHFSAATSCKELPATEALPYARRTRTRPLKRVPIPARSKGIYLASCRLVHALTQRLARGTARARVPCDRATAPDCRQVLALKVIRYLPHRDLDGPPGTLHGKVPGYASASASTRGSGSPPAENWPLYSLTRQRPVAVPVASVPADVAAIRSARR